MLNRLQEAQTELQTTLTVTKSNLTLALSNTEMLEEALQRADSAKGKDVGWRRWSDRELLLKQSTAGSSRPRTSNGADLKSSTNGATQSLNTLTEPPTPTPDSTFSTDSMPIPTTAPPHPPVRSQSELTPSVPYSASLAPPSLGTPIRSSAPSEGGFFNKLRFGVARTATPPPTTTSTSHLTSASLPALSASLEDLTPINEAAAIGSPIDGNALESAKAAASAAEVRAAERETALAREKERVAALEVMLEAEKKAKSELSTQKTEIENELESLSAALFEEVR